MKNLYLGRGRGAFCSYQFGSIKNGFTKRYGIGSGGWLTSFCAPLFEKFAETNIEVVPGTLYRVKSVKFELEEMRDSHD